MKCLPVCVWIFFRYCLFLFVLSTFHMATFFRLAFVSQCSHNTCQMEFVACRVLFGGCSNVYPAVFPFAHVRFSHVFFRPYVL